MQIKVTAQQGPLDPEMDQLGKKNKSNEYKINYLNS